MYSFSDILGTIIACVNIFDDILYYSLIIIAMMMMMMIRKKRMGANDIMFIATVS